jgi:hypothetical protein
MKGLYESRQGTIGILIGCMLALAGCAERTMPARTSLLPKEQAAVGNLDWVTSPAAVAMHGADPNQNALTTVHVVACGVVNANAARPKLVIDEPSCANFVVSNEGPRRID